MKIQVGDRVTYKLKLDNEVKTSLIESDSDIYLLKKEDAEILKIERTKYEVIEEKKEFLKEHKKNKKRLKF